LQILHVEKVSKGDCGIWWNTGPAKG